MTDMIAKTFDRHASYLPDNGYRQTLSLANGLDGLGDEKIFINNSEGAGR